VSLNKANLFISNSNVNHGYRFQGFNLLATSLGMRSILIRLGTKYTGQAPVQYMRVALNIEQCASACIFAFSLVLESGL